MKLSGAISSMIAVNRHARKGDSHRIYDSYGVGMQRASKYEV
jgi:hypothetical protein